MYAPHFYGGNGIVGAQVNIFDMWSLCLMLVSKNLSSYDVFRFLWELELLWPASTKATIRCASRCTETGRPIR